MKLSYSSLTFILFTSMMFGYLVSADQIDCKPLLKSVFDFTACTSRCVTISGNGLSAAGVHVALKGHLMNSNNGALMQQGDVNILSSNFFQCDSNNLFQPFLVDNVFAFNNFNLYSNGTILVAGVLYDLKCVAEHGNIFQFNYSSVEISFVLNVKDKCDPLYFGESCTPPSSTSSSATTMSSSTGSSNNIVISLSVVNKWVNNGVEYSQYQVTTRNNDINQIHSLVYGHTNFNPTDKWNIDTLPNGDLSMPSYASIAPGGGIFEWGYIARSDSNTEFFVKSFS